MTRVPSEPGLPLYIEPLKQDLTPLFSILKPEKELSEQRYWNWTAVTRIAAVLLMLGILIHTCIIVNVQDNSVPIDWFKSIAVYLLLLFIGGYIHYSDWKYKRSGGKDESDEARLRRIKRNFDLKFSAGVSTNLCQIQLPVIQMARHKHVRRLEFEKQVQKQKFALFLAGGQGGEAADLSIKYWYFWIFTTLWAILETFISAMAPHSTHLWVTWTAYALILIGFPLILFKMKQFVWSLSLEREASYIGRKLHKVSSQNHLQGEWQLARWIGGILKEDGDDDETTVQRREVVIKPILQRIDWKNIPGYDHKTDLVATNSDHQRARRSSE